MLAPTTPPPITTTRYCDCTTPPGFAVTNLPHPTRGWADDTSDDEILVAASPGITGLCGSSVPSTGGGSPCSQVANHSSHADTVLLQYLLAKHHRPLVLVAGAEDYWFRNRLLGRVAAFLGVFAFPRRGEIGVRRARKALRRRATVIIYPQGSRSGGRFRPGVGRIAFGKSTKVVPVRISGSDELLGKGSLWPRRCNVEISFGPPTSISLSESAEEFATRLGNSVLTEAERRVA